MEHNVSPSALLLAESNQWLSLLLSHGCQWTTKCFQCPTTNQLTEQTDQVKVICKLIHVVNCLMFDSTQHCIESNILEVLVGFPLALLVPAPH